MKKFLIIASLSLLVNQGVLAATASPSGTTESGTPTPTKTQKLEDLKERLATKVAEMRRSEKRAIFGTIKSTSLTSFVIETTNKNIKIELTDDIQVAQNIKGQRTKLTVDNLEKGDSVTVFGDYDPTLDLLKAKVIFIQGPLPLRVIGKVTAIDKVNYTITVETPEGQAYVVDIETDTKMMAWNPSLGMARWGFSKTATGDAVQVVAVPEPKQTTRVSARRILDLGNLTNPTPTQATTPTPSETPTGKATPSATPQTKP